MKPLTMPLLIIGSFLILTCSSGESGISRDHAPGEDRRAPSVVILECRNQEYVRNIETYGTISYVTKAEIYPMGDQIIEEMLFDEGDTVSSGDVHRD